MESSRDITLASTIASKLQSHHDAKKPVATPAMSAEHDLIDKKYNELTPDEKSKLIVYAKINGEADYVPLEKILSTLGTDPLFKPDDFTVKTLTQTYIANQLFLKKYGELHDEGKAQLNEIVKAIFGLSKQHYQKLKMNKDNVFNKLRDVYASSNIDHELVSIHIQRFDDWMRTQSPIEASKEKAKKASKSSPKQSPKQDKIADLLKSSYNELSSDDIRLLNSNVTQLEVGGSLIVFL